MLLQPARTLAAVVSKFSNPPLTLALTGLATTVLDTKLEVSWP
jgi:hypothetical protein